MNSFRWRHSPLAIAGLIGSILGQVAFLAFPTLPLAAASAAEDRILLRVARVPEDGLVVARVNLAAAADSCQTQVVPERMRAFATDNNREVPAQFVPDQGNLKAGTMLLRCDPAQQQARLWLDFSASPKPATPDAGEPKPPRPDTGNRVESGSTTTTVHTRWYSVIHDAHRMGGLPAEIVFAGTGMRFDALRWNDRLYHQEKGQFWLRHDPRPRVQCVSTGPLCTVVRVSARYTQPEGERPDSQPVAQYDWFYFNDRPLVQVRSVARQTKAQTWQEAHFLELGYLTNGFSQWAGGAPEQAGAFVGDEQSHRFDRWGAILEGRNAIGMFEAGPILLYDGRGYGRYLHAHADAAWQGWTTTEFERTAWLWIGADDRPAATVARQANPVPRSVRATVSVGRVQQRIDRLSAALARADHAARPQRGWERAAVRLLEKHGRLSDALELPPGRVPTNWSVIEAGDMRLVLEHHSDGIALLDLADAASGTLFLGTTSLPLFEATLRNTQTGEEIQLRSDHGWGQATLDREPDNLGATLRWHQPRPSAVGPLAITTHLRTDPQHHRVAWTLEAQGQANPWSLWEVRFPELVLSVEPQSELLLPQAAGVLKPVGREPLARFRGEYPSGWMSMQLAALYDPATRTGLYFGLHDPAGSTKVFLAESVEAAPTSPAGALSDEMAAGPAVRLGWDIPVPDMGRSGNRFVLSGEAVWQLLRGDWFDAALIYRQWARRDAKWFPKLGADGRSDTPAWMRDLGAWAMTGGAPSECVSQVLAFAQALGVPVGFHWYNWHQIPFDNDYPHYFPTREGFAEGVKQLQAGGVAVMPYINGRLWDTRDQGTNDFEFTSLARPAATKKQTGEPYLESYGSKESNGDPVRLAVMCPTTPLWQTRQHDMVMRLFNECGVKAVYIDQVAAAKPELCFDPAHGHPQGGGSWWNEQGYWPLLEQIRRDKPADRGLTTECNAEPFLRWFGGYLTWHWQYDGQVPLFPAVYGGAIHMFGRAYRGGPTKDLALRMKAAQQLVWGEQLGWIHPQVVGETNNFEFFREAVRLRWNLRRYVTAGQMARPPHLTGPIPKVTADWQWSGPWPVTTPAVLSGAWHRPGENRLALFFANVADQSVTASVQYDLRAAGLTGNRFARRRWTSQGESSAAGLGPVLDETVTFQPRSVWAWEIRAKDN